MKKLLLSFFILCISSCASFAIGPITGTTFVCTGFTDTLTDATAGGTWSSSNVAVAAVGSLGGVVYGVSSGPVTITYAVGTSYVTASFTVNATPAPITGTTSLCVGTSTTLDDATAGGSWSSSNTAVAGVISGLGLVTGLSAGTASIRYTLGTGCYAATSLTVTPTPTAITGAGSVCVGGTASLGDGAVGGTWGSSNTTVATIGSSSGVVLGIAAGTTNITYSLGGSCRVGFVETVVATPAAIIGRTGLCVGTTVTLTDATAGGAWASVNTLVATIGSTSGVLTGISIGTTIITYAVGTGCSATATVVVVPTPGAISGPYSVCIGGTAALTDGITTNAWTSANPSVASITPTGLLTGISAGTALISYYLGTSCLSERVETVSNAVINGLATLCLGSTTTLSSSVSGGTWSSIGTAATVGSATGIVTGVSAGTDIISYTVSSGCNSSTTVMVVTALPPVTGSAYLAVGSSETLVDSISGGAWSSNDTILATIDSATGVVSGWGVGTATITYSLGAGCFVTFPIHIFTEGVTNIASISYNLTLYPNPVSNELTIESNPTAYNSFSIINEMGQLMIRQPINAPKTNVDVTGLPPGVYFISFRGNGGSSVQRFLKD